MTIDNHGAEMQTETVDTGDTATGQNTDSRLKPLRLLHKKK